MNDIKTDLEQSVSQQIGQPVRFHLTERLDHGDLTTPVALELASQYRRTAAHERVPGPFGHEQPSVIAEAVAEVLRALPLGKFVEVAVVMPGHMNVFIKPEVLVDQVQQQLAVAPGSPISIRLKGQTSLIEYSSPNIAKPMHVGHFRTTVRGDALKRIFSAVGARAIGMNHIGDWGTQFGKVLAAYKQWGDQEMLATGSVHDLLSLYVRFHDQVEKDPTIAAAGSKEFAKLEQGDPENRRLWERMRDLSLPHFYALYKRMGITIEEEQGESFYESRLAPLIAEALKKGVAETSDGAVVIPVGPGIPPCLIRKSDGTTLYATRDLAQINYRVSRWHPTRILYVVGSEQTLHFRQIFAAAAKLGYQEQTELVHVSYGEIRLPSGKMSTRAGRIVFLEDLVDEAVLRARNLLIDKSRLLDPHILETVAETIGIGALKYQILHQHRNTAIVFDWETMLTLQGNTGPYLQYTAARAHSVLAGADGGHVQLDLQDADGVERDLARWMLRLPWVLERAASEYAPNYLADWLYRLASDFNRFYEDHPILQAGASDRKRRLALTAAVAHSLRYGLHQLGIETPEHL
ncbi:arginine--tRNA ligase [Candidatus Berkelbacteria bacterium]|nr:arginine--tRNA ligase [Candidatus Berkelbacteria bacterium]